MIVLSKSIPIRISPADLSFGLPVRVRTAFGFTGCSNPQVRNRLSLFRTGTHHEQILRHRIVTGMHNLIVHRKHKNAGEILLEQHLEFLAALAIAALSSTRWRGILLRLQRARADNENTVIGKRTAEIRNESVFILGREILDLIETKYSIVPSRHRGLDDVVNIRLQRPALVMAGAYILDEVPVGIVDAYLIHLLEHDARAKCITATDLGDVMPPIQHLGDKLVAREQKGQMTRVIVPDLAG